MKTDLFIYAKDSHGWTTFVSPDYIEDTQILYLAPLTEMPSDPTVEVNVNSVANSIVNSLDSDSDIDVRVLSDQLWKDTFIFICSQEYNLCTLLRWARISEEKKDEAESYGIMMRDAENRPNWTLEGVCSDYSSKDEFMMYIPSLILWMKRQPDTLFFEYVVQKCIGSQVELPEELLFNPFDPSRSGKPSVVSNDDTCWYSLVNEIHYSSHIFSFLYGPLVNVYSDYNKYIGDVYPVDCKFYDGMEIKRDYSSPWKKVDIIKTKQPSKERHFYRMDFRISNLLESNMGIKAKTELNEIGNTSGSELRYETKPIKLADDPDDIDRDEVDLIELEFQAERVRSWAKENKWKVSDEEETDYRIRYYFEVEE